MYYSHTDKHVKGLVSMKAEELRQYQEDRLMHSAPSAEEKMLRVETDIKQPGNYNCEE